ncbi:MAG: permease [Dehalococcoidales bacterium]
MIRKPDKTVLLLVALVLLALGTAFLTGGWQLAFDGLKQTGRLFNTVWLRLLLGFTLGGLIRVVIPHALIAKWLGHTSGLKGILIGSYIGIIIPGGPFVFLPIIASIYSAGAGVGPVIALLTGRALLSIHMLVVWYIPFLGAEIPLAGYLTSLLIPPILGLAGIVVFRIITRFSSPASTHTDENRAVGKEGDGEETL